MHCQTCMGLTNKSSIINLSLVIFLKAEHKLCESTINYQRPVLFGFLGCPNQAGGKSRTSANGCERPLVPQPSNRVLCRCADGHQTAGRRLSGV